MDNQEILNFKMPRYEHLPLIDLYIDQVLEYIDTIFAPLQLSGSEKLLTASMINNYVKKGVVPAPVKKKYSRRHIAYIIIVYISKQIFTIDEISRMIQVQKASFDINTTYDYMCGELEEILYSVFGGRPLAPDSTKTNAPERYFVRNTLVAFVHKIYTQKLLNLYFKEEEG